ncbi:MAG: Fe-S cluster assembly protein SufD [Firmicutes bacterium]|nr:Fe-S cluster assembly protein SufD [Bacillota bacterium]
MTKNDTKSLKLNKLPVITWRWLKVNEFNLKDFKLENIPAYNKNSINSHPVDEIEVNIIDNSVEYLEIEKYFNSLDNVGVSQEFTKMADSMYNCGIQIIASKNKKVSEPVFLRYSTDNKNPMIVDQNLIIAEENSTITVIIDYTSDDSTPGFHNGMTKIYAKDGAIVNLIKLQTMNDTSLNLDANIAYIGHGAKVNNVSLELGSDKSVVSYINNLEKDTAESNLDSIYLVDNSRLIDMNYLMNHFGRRTISNINTYGALKDKSKKTFKGTLDFKRGSSLSKGSEEEYAILLDKDVKSDAIPLLLCEEEDVEGLHAASAGRIDENKLFYLMSRGFSEREAKKLIIESYFRPIIDKIPLSQLRKKVENHIENRLLKI